MFRRAVLLAVIVFSFLGSFFYSLPSLANPFNQYQMMMQQLQMMNMQVKMRQVQQANYRQYSAIPDVIAINNASSFKGLPPMGLDVISTQPALFNQWLYMTGYGADSAQ